MKSFVETQFGYCPLVLMFHGREIIRKINHMHERFLCALSIKITIALSVLTIETSVSVYTIETSRVWPLNYSK